MSAALKVLGLSAALLLSGVAAGEPPPLESFAALPRMYEVSIAPHGGHLALLASDGQSTWAAVRAVSGTEVGPPRSVLAAPPGTYLNWCRFATDERLLCSYTRVAHHGGRAIETRRLLAVDADGGHPMELLRDTRLAAAQLQDTVIDWSPGPADTVLLEAIDPASSYFNLLHGGPRAPLPPPSVYALNVVTGATTLYAAGHSPIRHYLSDGRGQLRIGWGVNGTQFSYYARNRNDPNWRRIAVFETFTSSNVIRPIGVDPTAPDALYGIGDFQGRDAIWRIDLNGQPPAVLIQNPDVDVDAPVFGADGRLLGAYYQTDYPHALYVDPTAAQAAAAAQAAYPDLFTTIVDATRDESTFLLRGRSDVEGGHYLLYTKGALADVGRAYPDVAPESLARQRPIVYPARGGARIPGYLTRPEGAQGPLPLVVLPHGGPVARDGWSYDYLRQFLASRGYAVLQANFRGSDGYGRDWLYAALQDWGGVSYDDLIDGVRWSVAQGVADPSRIAIVGWSFGGYLSLLAATREPELFRCAVSIAGISDPKLLETEHDDSLYGAALHRQIGDNPERLARETPLLHAPQVRIPVLLVHGEDDTVVPLEQSLAMAAALERNGKHYGLLRIAGGDHSLTTGPARVEMLRALGEFLDPCLAVSPGTDLTATMR
jgi:dipeptidyl aminopeptidase/acylaminoacyl peptidase